MPGESSHGNGTDPKGRLAALRNGLLRLHSALLASERDLYERDTAPIRTSGQFLDLVLNDSAFSWLRQLSGLVVIVDEALEGEQEPGPADADRLVNRARALLSPARTNDVFAARYLEALQRDPNVVMAHSAALQLLRELS